MGVDTEQDECKFVSDDFNKDASPLNSITTIINGCYGKNAMNNMKVAADWILFDTAFSVGRKQKLFAPVFVKVLNDKFYLVGLVDDDFSDSACFIGLLKRDAKIAQQFLDGTKHAVGDYASCNVDISGLQYGGGKQSITMFLQDLNQPVVVHDFLDLSQSI